MVGTLLVKKLLLCKIGWHRFDSFVIVDKYMIYIVKSCRYCDCIIVVDIKKKSDLLDEALRIANG